MKKIMLVAVALMMMVGMGKIWAAELPAPQFYWRFLEFSGNLGSRAIGGITYYTCFAPSEEAYDNYNAKQCQGTDRVIPPHQMYYNETNSLGVRTTGAGAFWMPSPGVSIVGTCNLSFYNLCVRSPVSAP